MLHFWIFFGALQIFSLIFYFIVLHRVRKHTRPYLLLETPETKLFGFLSLKGVFFFYFLSIFLLAFFEFFIIFFALK